jgi:UDP-N-acetylmuramoyl-L-alanyl-D-glutamate--2,6-diaminopimelate ligase
LRFASIIAGMPDLAACQQASWRRADALEVTGITADSREVRPGMIFAALPGVRADGRAFIADAIARGASAVLAPPDTALPGATPLLADALPRRRLARIAALLAPPQPDCVVAVTGTNGKTSTTDFLRQIWMRAGHRAACLGTLGVVTEHGAEGPGLTTPDPVALSQALGRLARGGVRHAALEASSHGLDQFRLDGLRIAAGAFTNLTRDHLDYHGSMAAYRAAKLRLFDELLPEGASAVACTTLDGETLAELRAIAARRRLVLRMVGDGEADLRLLRTTPLPHGQVLEVAQDGARHEIALALPGRFQADNALVAAALAQATGVEDALAHLPALLGVRGRMELAATLGNGAAVYVDYAHTPDALERLLAALRPHTCGRLHAVFGAGGDRDPGKRPLMGAAVAAHADVAIVTDDNPRTEDAAAIRAAVLAGMGAMPGARAIGGRAEAIAAALAALGPGDVLAVAGKGHEQGQTIGTETIPFDDVAVVRRLAGLA